MGSLNDSSNWLICPQSGHESLISANNYKATSWVGRQNPEDRMKTKIWTEFSSVGPNKLKSKENHMTN